MKCTDCQFNKSSGGRFIGKSDCYFCASSVKGMPRQEEMQPLEPRVMFLEETDKTTVNSLDLRIQQLEATNLFLKKRISSFSNNLNTNKSITLGYIYKGNKVE